MEYKTRFIVEAASLIYYRAQLKNIELNQRQGTFVLDNVPESLVDEYAAGTLRVEPRAFNDTVRFLNSSIQNLIRNREVVA